MIETQSQIHELMENWETKNDCANFRQAVALPLRYRKMHGSQCNLPETGRQIPSVMLTDTGISIAETLTRQQMPQQSEYFESLEAAIAIGHKCKAVHKATVFVHERTEYGLTIWKGNVEIFDVDAHPTAKICYAWKHSEGSRTKIFTILGNKLVNSAQRAVQAMICADQQPIKLIPPLANGLELLRQQMEEAKKIIHQTEIKSEDLEISVENAKQNELLFQKRQRRPAARLGEGGNIRP